MKPTPEEIRFGGLAVDCANAFAEFTKDLANAPGMTAESLAATMLTALQLMVGRALHTFSVPTSVFMERVEATIAHIRRSAS